MTVDLIATAAAALGILAASGSIAPAALFGSVATGVLVCVVIKHA